MRQAASGTASIAFAQVAMPPNNALERTVKERGPRLARESGRRAAAQLDR